MLPEQVMAQRTPRQAEIPIRIQAATNRRRSIDKGLNPVSPRIEQASEPAEGRKVHAGLRGCHIAV